MKAVEFAVREVAPLTGRLDGLAFDNAGQVYLEACGVLGVQATVQSARDVYRAVLAAKSGLFSGCAASRDSRAENGFQSRFER